VTAVTPGENFEEKFVKRPERAGFPGDFGLD
jgi:hypothetical protein